MHVLISPAPTVVDGRLAGVGHVGDDFCWTTPGELLLPVLSVCDDPKCGCARSFTGVESRKETTVAVVADRDVRAVEVYELAAESTRRAGWNEPGDLSAVSSMLDDALDWAASVVVGTRVRMRYTDAGIEFDAV